MPAQAPESPLETPAAAEAGTRPERGAAADAAPFAERRITDAPRIAQILQRVRDSRALLTARLPGIEASFLTTVLGVEPRLQRIQLDELNPRAGHEALLRIQVVSVWARLAGVEVAFRSRLERVDTLRAAAVYTLPFPSVLLYQQRRDAYRVGVTPSLAVRAWLAQPGGERLPAEVRDLSQEGLCLHVTGDRLDGAAVGARLAGCELLLPDGLRLGCEFEVRWAIRGDGHRGWRVGARFVGLSTHHRRAIAHLIAQLERERLRLAPARPPRT